MTMILVVDDALEIRDLMTAFLTDEGFDVTACDGTDEARARLDLSLPDILILDGRLPMVSGWQFLALLRASDSTIKLPVLMLSAAVDELERRRQGPTDDCTAYLDKPFDLDELLIAIREVIETCKKDPVAV